MTARLSVRARAREVYGEMAEKLASQNDLGGEGADRSSPRESAAASTPNPSPLLASASGGGEKKASASGETSLTTRIRDLYEKSAVPVREVARIAGVTERTLYKYVQKGGWTRRYQVLPRGEAAAAANRGRRWAVAPERLGHSGTNVAPAKGAGGRFIRREDIGKPYPTGLKALDPAGRTIALAASGKAKNLSRRAQAMARKEARYEVFVQALADNARFFADFRKHQKIRARRRPCDMQLRIGGLLLNSVEWSQRRVAALMPDLAAMFPHNRRRVLRAPCRPNAQAAAALPPATPAPLAPRPFDPDDYRNYPRP